MELNQYQEGARETAQYPCIGHLIVYPALGLAGESGEVADKVKKLFRDGGGVLTNEYRRMLALELGDVLWYVANFAHELGYTLEEVAVMNLFKLADRQKRGQIGGNGDER